MVQGNCHGRYRQSYSRELASSPFNAGVHLFSPLQTDERNATLSMPCLRRSQNSCVASNHSSACEPDQYTLARGSIQCRLRNIEAPAGVPGSDEDDIENLRRAIERDILKRGGRRMDAQSIAPPPVNGNLSTSSESKKTLPIPHNLKG